MTHRIALGGSMLLALALVYGPATNAQSKKGKATPATPAPATAAPKPQKLDEEYTKLIKEYLQDPRITTELVDHMPASDTVPSPLEVPRPHSRQARRTHLRQGHLPLLRSAG